MVIELARILNTPGTEFRSGRNKSTIFAAENEAIAEFLSSRTRLQIAERISRRPRTLRELARITRLSVPGVLRHIEAMSKSGLVKEVRISPSQIPVRKVYSLKGYSIVDFSIGNLAIFKVAKVRPMSKEANPGELEWLATEILVGKRRIKEKAKRLARAIDELIEDEGKLLTAIDSLKLNDDQRMILLTAYTEETLDDAEYVLSRIQGVKDARRSIDKALAKARHSA